MTTAYLSLGSNQSNRERMLEEAIAGITPSCGPLIARSAFYETAAWGLEGQPDFLNMVLSISTTLTPSQLLAGIREIETRLGRQRTIKWGPRTIDIDILFFGNDIINTPDLEIPHPRLHDRRFVMVPLVEIAPLFVHPLLLQTTAALLASCTDPLVVKKIG